MAKLWDRLRRRLGGREEQDLDQRGVLTTVDARPDLPPAPASVERAAPDPQPPAYPAAPDLDDALAATAVPDVSRGESRSRSDADGRNARERDAAFRAFLPAELLPLAPDIRPGVPTEATPAAGPEDTGISTWGPPTPAAFIAAAESTGEDLSELAGYAASPASTYPSGSYPDPAPAAWLTETPQAAMADIADAEVAAIIEDAGEDVGEPAAPEAVDAAPALGGIQGVRDAAADIGADESDESDESDDDEPEDELPQTAVAVETVRRTRRGKRGAQREPDELDGQPARLTLPGRPLKRNEVPTLDTPLILWSHDPSGAVVVRPTLYACVQTQWYGSSLYFLVIPWNERDAPERSARLVVDASQLRVAPAEMAR